MRLICSKKLIELSFVFLDDSSFILLSCRTLFGVDIFLKFGWRYTQLAVGTYLPDVTIMAIEVSVRCQIYLCLRHLSQKICRKQK